MIRKGQVRRMSCAALVAAASAILPSAGAVSAQQVPDRAFQPPVEHPAFAVGAGPVVCVDEAHANFHTSGHRFWPFAELLRRDGYVVRAGDRLIADESLRSCRVLVIANASAPFKAEEIAAAVRWVDAGGCLLLIADHRPYGAGLPLTASIR